MDIEKSSGHGGNVGVNVGGAISMASALQGTVVQMQARPQVQDGFFDRLIVNTIMRIVGVLIRSMVLVVGLMAIVSEIAFGLFVLMLWILGPFIIAAGAAQGIRFLLS